VQWLATNIRELVDEAKAWLTGLSTYLPERLQFATKNHTSCSQLFAFYEESKSWVSPPYVVPADVEKFSFPVEVF